MWTQGRHLVFIFLVTLALTAVGCRFVFARDRTARVVLLGSGNRLSALIIDGDARVLIASGTDGAAFLNAFASALPINDRGVDVLIIAGDRRDLPVAAAARSSVKARRTFVLDGGLSTSLDELHLDSGALLATGKRIALTPNLAVSIETLFGRQGDQTISGWQATVVRGATRVRIASDSRWLDEFRDRRPASALVIASLPDAREMKASFSSLIVPAALGDATPLLTSDKASVPVSMVEDGRTITLRFTIDGLELPASARRLATPVAQTGEPPRAAMSATNSAWIASRSSLLTSTS